MKITDPEIIRNGEKDLIDSVQADLDLEAVREILKHRMSASTLSSRGGQIVVHDNQIAFRLDFDFKVSGSLLFDREGNYIPDMEEPTPEPAEARDPAEDRGPVPLDDPPLDDLPMTETEDDDLGGLGLDDDDIDIPDLTLDDPPGDGDPEDDAMTDINPPDVDLTDMKLPDMDLGPDLGLDDDEDETGPVPPGIGDDDLLLDDDDGLMDDIDEDLSAGIPDELTLEGAEDETDLMGVSLDGVDLDDTDLVDTDLVDTDLDDDDLLQEDMLDDDINDILKESREFWEQKKDS